MTRFSRARQAMRDSKVRYKDLSVLTGFSVSRLCNAVNGRPASEKVKRSMALALGVPFEELWIEGEAIFDREAQKNG